jgi:hypothetical protein
MALQKVAGEKLYVGGVLPDKAADYVAADFTSQTWVLVDGYASRPPLGDQSTEIATDLINRGRTVVQKGTRRSPAGEHRFAAIANDAGQIALKAAADSNANYAFRLVKDDAPAPKSTAVTITIAAPGVVSWTAHGLSNGDPVAFSTGGALPTGLTAGVTYYVTGVSANSFSVAATSGGTAIITTGAQSGTHTATTVPTGSVSYFIGLVLSKTDQGGEANTASMITFNIAPNSNIVEVAAKPVA